MILKIVAKGFFDCSPDMLEVAIERFNENDYTFGEDVVKRIKHHMQRHGGEQNFSGVSIVEQQFSQAGTLILIAELQLQGYKVLGIDGHELPVILLKAKMHTH